MKPIRFTCPLCAKIFLVAADMLGRPVKCPHCDGEVEIPGSQPSASRPPRSAKPSTVHADPAAAQPPAAPPAIPPPVAPPVVGAFTNGSSGPIPQPPCDPNMRDRYPPGYAPKHATAASKSTTESAKAPDRSPLGPDPASKTKRAKIDLKGEDSGSDSLLPPAVPTPSQKRSATKQSSPADPSFSPAIDDANLAAPGQRMPLPIHAPPNVPVTDPRWAGPIVSLEAKGGFATAQEAAPSAGSGSPTQILHSRPPRVKARQRFVKTVVVWIFCALVLGLTLTYFLLIKG